MRGDTGEFGGHRQPPDYAAQRLRVDRVARVGAEDQVVIGPGRAGGAAFVLLACQVGSQHGDGVGVQGQGAPTLVGLRFAPRHARRPVPTGLRRDQGAPNRGESRVKIQCPPGEPEGLASARTGHRQEPPGRVEPKVPGRFQVAAQIVSRPGEQGRAVAFRGLRRIRGVGGIAHEAVPANGVPQCPVRDDVDVNHRSRGQPGVLGGTREQECVVRVERPAVEALEQGASDGAPGQMQAHVPAVAVERCRSQGALHRGQPVIDQEVPEGLTAGWDVGLGGEISKDLGQGGLGLPARSEATASGLVPLVGAGLGGVDDERPTAVGLLPDAAPPALACHRAPPSRSAIQLASARVTAG